MLKKQLNFSRFTVHVTLLSSSLIFDRQRNACGSSGLMLIWPQSLWRFPFPILKNIHKGMSFWDFREQTKEYNRHPEDHTYWRSEVLLPKRKQRLHLCEEDSVVCLSKIKTFRIKKHSHYISVTSLYNLAFTSWHVHHMLYNTIFNLDLPKSLVTKIINIIY